MLTNYRAATLKGKIYFSFRQKSPSDDRGHKTINLFFTPLSLSLLTDFGRYFARRGEYFFYKRLACPRFSIKEADGSDPLLAERAGERELESTAQLQSGFPASPEPRGESALTSSQTKHTSRSFSLSLRLSISFSTRSTDGHKGHLSR